MSSATVGAEIIAEDLGVVPDFVRARSLAGIPGYRVFRWERHWNQPGQPFGTRRVPVTGRHVRHTRHRADGHLVGGGASRRTRRSAGDSIGRERLTRQSERGARASALPHVRGAAGVAVRLRLEYADPADSGYLRLARSHQSAGDGGDQNWTWRLPWPIDRLLTSRRRWRSRCSCVMRRTHGR